jgi:hypothetical protein
MAKDRPQLPFPLLDADDSTIVAYKDHHFNYESNYRNRHMERMALALHYRYGRQWIEPSVDLLLDGTRGYLFRDKRLEGYVDMPRPITNKIGVAVDIEQTSLGKRELIPNVVPDDKDPRIQAAAREAREILNDRLKKLFWPELREQVTHTFIVCGIAIFKSFWDNSYLELVMKANPLAKHCPMCGTKVSSPIISVSLSESVKFNQNGIKELPSDGEELEIELSACPSCPGPLVPYEMDEEEAANGTDMFGREMGVPAPKGNTCIEEVSPFDFFPENSGVGLTRANTRIWGQATVRSLDWVYERYPEWEGELTPEEPSELMKYHPLLGTHDIIGVYDQSLDVGVYENHIRLFEIYHDKSKNFPLGAKFCIAGDKVHRDDLYVELEDAEHYLCIPKTKYADAKFRPRMGEFWSHGLVDDMISPQNRLNGIDAQTTEARLRMGSPNILASENHNLNTPVWFSEYGVGKIITYTPDPLNPTATPTTFGGDLMNSEVYKEREAMIQDMRELAGPADIEIGEAPRNISTTSGLQLLGEAAERRRATRERALTDMFEQIWEHQLQLIWAMRIDKDSYTKQSPDKTWEEVQYDRMAIAGQTRVKIEKQAYVDKSLYQREGVREAQADLLYDLSTAAARKKVLEYRGLPTDVNEDMNYQVDRAKEQWTEFVDAGKIPYIDHTIDDPVIHFQVLATFLKSDEGKRLQEAVGWPEVAKRIVGWEEELRRLEMMDAMVKETYGGVVDPQTGAEKYAELTAVYQGQKAAWEQNETARQGDMTGAIPPLPPPQEPPQPIFLPPATEERIYMVWKKLLMVNGQPLQQQQPPPLDATVIPPPALPGQNLESFLRFRAVVDAYGYLAKQQAMETGAPMPPAPGTPEGSPDAGGGPPGIQAPPNPPTPPEA